MARTRWHLAGWERSLCGGLPASPRVGVAEKGFSAYPLDSTRARASRTWRGTGRQGSLRLAEWFGAFSGKPDLAAQVSVWGALDECVAGLRDIVAGGAKFLMLNPVFDELEHLERFASEIAPKL